MILEIGIADGRIAAKHAADLPYVRGRGTRLDQHPSGTGIGLSQRAVQPSERDGLPATELQADVQMILQVAPDILRAADDVDAVLSQLVLRTDSRQHEELRAVDRPG